MRKTRRHIELTDGIISTLQDLGFEFEVLENYIGRGCINVKAIKTSNMMEDFFEVIQDEIVSLGYVVNDCELEVADSEDDEEYLDRDYADDLLNAYNFLHNSRIDSMGKDKILIF